MGSGPIGIPYATDLFHVIRVQSQKVCLARIRGMNEKLFEFILHALPVPILLWRDAVPKADSDRKGDQSKAVFDFVRLI